jgi:hypothetical protein
VTPFGSGGIRGSRSLARLVAAAFALSFATACADDGNGALGGSGPEPGDELGQQSGSLSIDLNTGEKVTFSSFSYAIVRPGFAKSGSIDVSQSSRVAATLAGLPPATGYSLTLMGTSTAPVEAQCSGSAAFDITAGQVTSVPVSLACHVNEVTPPVQAPLPPLVPVAVAVLLAGAGAARVRKRRVRG